MAKALRVGTDFTLPLEAVTQTFGILAKKRAGKSNTAVVMAEEMYDAELPWVAIDPKGDWWGVRAAGDGKGPGLAVVVFGGQHGDVPLEPGAGRLIADLVVEQRVTCVLDVSEMSKADQRRFLFDFADRLYRTNTEPLHVFCEEADEYIPQRVMGEMARLVGAFETLVKRGGFRGIGITLITQRSASLNKDVLTQIDTLIAMRTLAPNDRKAVLGWVEQHEVGREAVDELPNLADGQAYVFSPAWLQVLKRVQFRRRRTYDSGATPKVGESRRPPARLADVDLVAIKEAMAETIQRAKADDPKELRKRIVELERQLKAAPTVPQPEVRVERVEVPVLSEELATRIEEALGPAVGLLGEVQETLLRHRLHLEGQRQAKRPPVERAVPRPPPERRLSSTPSPRRPAPAEGVSGPQQRILDSLAWFASVGIDPVDRTQLALFAGASPKSSAYGNNLGTLRTADLIAYPGRGTISLTDAGRTVSVAADDIRTTKDLHEALFGRLPGPQVRILQVLVDAYPADVERDELAVGAGASPTSSAFGNNLGALRTLGLIDYPARGRVIAREVLFLGGRR